MILAWWEGLLLGVIQGLSEFLPISSSGHLVLAQGLLGYSEPGVLLEVLVHVATLLSVVIVYRTRLAGLAVGIVQRDPASLRFGALLAVASVPAAVAGLTLREFFEAQFESYTAVGIDFLITGAILWSTRWLKPRTAPARLTASTALLVGLAQALAIMPGISRSGTTIAAALWRGIDPREAAEFSFLMAVVVIAGTGLLQAGDALSAAGPQLGAGHAWAFGGALVSGVAAIKFLVMLLRHGRFHNFAPYCAAVGLLTLALFSWG